METVLVAVAAATAAAATAVCSIVPEIFKLKFTEIFHEIVRNFQKQG